MADPINTADDLAKAFTRDELAEQLAAAAVEVDRLRAERLDLIDGWAVDRDEIDRLRAERDALRAVDEWKRTHVALRDALAALHADHDGDRDRSDTSAGGWEYDHARMAERIAKAARRGDATGGIIGTMSTHVEVDPVSMACILNRLDNARAVRSAISELIDLLVDTRDDIGEELEQLLHVAASVREYRAAFRLELGPLAHVHPTVTDARDAMFAALSELDQ